jgi:uncharacterized membrane protein
VKPVVLRRVMIGLAAVGLVLAAYLTYVHYAGIKPVCTAGESCIKVQTSQWALLDGVPVALLGLIGYAAILASLLAPDREESRLATLALTMIGFGFSGYLTYRELFSIHAVCEECATSAVILTVLFVCAVFHYLAGPAAAGPAAAGPAAAGPAAAGSAAAGSAAAGDPAAASAAGARTPAEPTAKAAASATLSADGQ